MAQGQLILMLEGESEYKSVPRLVNRMILPPSLRMTGSPHVLHGVSNLAYCQNGQWRLVGNEQKTKWLSYFRGIRNAYVLVLLDGDGKEDSGKRFCVRDAACFLTRSAQEAGAGKIFSLAVVFARQEFESWLLAGCESLYSNLSERDIAALEDAPRDAKKKIRDIKQGRYKEIFDQPEFVKQLDIDLLSSRMRSFRRFEHALSQLAEAAETGRHICTPVEKEF